MKKYWSFESTEDVSEATCGRVKQQSDMTISQTFFFPMMLYKNTLQSDWTMANLKDQREIKNENYVLIIWFLLVEKRKKKFSDLTHCIFYSLKFVNAKRHFCIGFDA